MGKGNKIGLGIASAAVVGIASLGLGIEVGKNGVDTTPGNPRERAAIAFDEISRDCGRIALADAERDAKARYDLDTMTPEQLAALQDVDTTIAADQTACLVATMAELSAAAVDGMQTPPLEYEVSRKG